MLRAGPSSGELEGDHKVGQEGDQSVLINGHEDMPANDEDTAMKVAAILYERGAPMYFTLRVSLGIGMKVYAFIIYACIFTLDSIALNGGVASYGRCGASHCMREDRNRASKFVTDVKLAKSLYTTNYDQLYAYLSQHERHVNEVRLMRERYPDPLALVANSQTLFNPSQSPQHSGPVMHPPPQQFTPVYAAPIHHQQHHTQVHPQQQIVSPQQYISPSVTQQPQAEFPQMDSALTIPMFQQGEDPIECINKAMAFLSVVASRQTQSFAGNGNKGSAKNSRGNYAASQLRVVKCYNCQGEGHMTRQCTQPKRPRNTAWFKEKLMLAEAQEAGQILDEEQLAFLADPRIKDTLVAQQTIPQNSTFQTGDLDAYDSDCDDLSSAKAVLMANLSNCDSDVLSEVPYSDSYPNDMLNQDVQEMMYSEQTHIVDFPDNEIHIDSNIIPYSQYLQET
ncbi:retrovirus-related pol polyprotein from transposon TNT 1-94 [Tanacetum coccineum]